MKGLDQFYTDPAVAKNFVKLLSEKVDLSNMSLLEPSAGQGAFVQPLSEFGEVLAYDLEARGQDIRKANFLTDDVFPDSDNIAVIGNPPFGFSSLMAIKFFNRAAKNAKLIAFILPRTFRKVSVQNKLDRNFWLFHDENVPSKSFIRNDRMHDVPCAWQIWKRRKEQRRYITKPDVSHIIEYTNIHNADFAFRRVGGRAGEILPLRDGQTYSAQSTYFIRALWDNAADLLASIDWTDIRNSTVGVRSVSKREIALELIKLVA